MKRAAILLVLIVCLCQACATEKSGCPGTNNYSKKERKQNMRAVKQTRLF
ncbi:hypothetical protein LX64_02819 [Chitinophaga skermanii]|uniref:Uncharacterized protein n=1 Tax=Chitinophaga skermanii TaxID=331697 RepID=A0A327QJU2_9BACT|nr:hypothetical protein [Chitinophaga skermanii]RAJ03942.1 hypothetical protein LX64_02819 [Chitinophaga skermanii]